MPSSFLRPEAANPVTLPDGTVLENLVYLNQVIDHPNIEIGDYSYFNSFHPVEDWASRIAPYLYAGAPERLTIGKFCQFAQGVLFITSSANHPMGGFSTYPFAIFNLETMGVYAQNTEAFQDTHIGNDVWIGHDAKIMPGVIVSDGAIIATGSVVTSDVGPYMIVGGNPAKPIRPRFEADVIDSLLETKWWDWPIEDIQRHLPLIVGADIGALKAVSVSKAAK
ncbi:CatB-related O-acetyltransferase [Falsihalocynthiibacter sp. BN13B15]|uniref:CatB-related O-acetyltransferase n=1 Tax=Falsihalocynthiibacter sp. BN13B15 TaxID=3240871 RepID=UPI00350EA68C